jgi:hypothetical protein
VTGTAYLNRTMLARFLACLALVTGLAALGAPTSQQIEADGGIASPAKSAACNYTDQRNITRAADQSQVKCRTRKPVVIYIPTVQFGADRAYE